jgi:hypothetical protein
MPASLTFQGVVKSGSPTPNDMAPSIVDRISKNFLMPEGEMLSTRFEITPRARLERTTGLGDMG